MLVIPAIDVYKNKCVRLYKGDYDQSTIYSDDPVEVIKNWELKGASLIHIVDLEGAKLGTTISSNLIKNMINNKRACYDFHVDMKSSKWTGAQKLQKCELPELPKYLINNKDKYSIWLE